MNDQILKSNKKSICIVTTTENEYSGGTNTLITNIINIFQSMNLKIYLIGFPFAKKMASTIKNIQFLQLYQINTNSIILRIIKCILLQLQISLIMIKTMNKIQNGFLFISGSLLLPTITARIFGKDAILLNPASESARIKFEYNSIYMKYFLSYLISILETLTRVFSTKIVLSTENLLYTLDLSDYSNKIYYAPGEVVKCDEFSLKNEYNNRDNIIGYIGRLSPEKGILNFVKAIPKILVDNENFHFLIVGDGSLKTEIEGCINEEDLKKYVTLTGWVSRDEIPEHLNKLKLLVLPSFTEGLPNIVLEAMACGTPVLSTPVGSVPDIIIDGYTGFLMENNSPSCISKHILRAFSSDNLIDISKNSIDYVSNYFSFNTAIEKYNEVIKEKNI